MPYKGPPVSGLFKTQIDATTRYCAVFGHPIKHSASPAMQNAGMAALGLNCRYLAFDVRPEDVASALNGARTMGFVGVNLTVPHKLLAVPLMDALDVSAASWGSVNTVRFEGKTRNGEWLPVLQWAGHEVDQVRMQGFNTDADAIIRGVEEDLKIHVSEAKVLLLGAGGAGRTAALKLAADGVRKLYLMNRTTAKAREVLEEIRARFPGNAVEIGYPSESIDLVINATSAGLKADDPLPLDTGSFPLERAGAVYDMIYRPAETPLLKTAKKAGCQTANGLSMLLHQGARALELWTGQKAPIEAMKTALVANLYG